jgi:hypothetical protein
MQHHQGARKSHKLAPLPGFALSLVACLAISLAASITISANEAQALNSKLENYDAAAQKAFDNGDYRRAQVQWERLKSELARNRDESEKERAEIKMCRVRTLKGLGECSMALNNFAQASALLTEAKSTLGGDTTDSALESALVTAFNRLSTNYREIDPGSFGDEVAAAFRDVKAEKISIARTEAGHHIEITLADKVIKPIAQRNVTEIGFDKVISFDLSEPAAGEVKIEHITGLKVHAQLWVNVVASRVRKNQEDQPIAEVTGEKMGFSQSVSSKLPEQIYQPIVALVSRVRNVFSGETSQAATAASSASSASTTPSAPTASTASTAPTATPASTAPTASDIARYSTGVNDGSQSGEIIPASNGATSAAEEMEN